jgi:hypothetical protein
MIMKEVHFTPDDYEWVKKTIRQHSRGLSVRDIEKISKDQRDIKHNVWYERPPGRDKIFYIVKKYAGIDWDYKIGKGGGKQSLVKIKKVDTTAIIGSTVKDMLISQVINSLEDLYERKKIKFTLLEIIELHKIKESIITFPTEVLYHYYRQKKEREIKFTRALGISKNAIKKIRKIELEQKKINNKFEKTFTCLEEIRNSNLLQAEIFGNSRYKSFLSPRNIIQTLHKLKH